MTLVALSGMAQEPSLLTDNGLENAKFSEYKSAARLRTGGRYTVNPALASDKGAPLVFTFAEGRFTNGDSSFQYKRDPGPYSYWQGVGQGSTSTRWSITVGGLLHLSLEQSITVDVL